MGNKLCLWKSQAAEKDQDVCVGVCLVTSLGLFFLSNFLPEPASLEQRSGDRGDSSSLWVDSLADQSNSCMNVHAHSHTHAG